jgi:hypothetical protein
MIKKIEIRMFCFERRKKRRRDRLAKKTRPKTMIKGDKKSHFPKSPANPKRTTATWISTRLCFFAIRKKGTVLFLTGFIYLFNIKEKWDVPVFIYYFLNS